MAQFTFTECGNSFKIPRLYAAVLNCLIRHDALRNLDVMDYDTGQRGQPSVTDLLYFINRMTFEDECFGRTRSFINMALINTDSKELAHSAYQPRNYKNRFDLGRLNGFLTKHQVEEGVWRATADESEVTCVLSNNSTLTVGGVEVNNGCNLPFAELLVGTCLYLILRDRGACSFEMYLDPNQLEWLEPFYGSTCFILQSQQFFQDDAKNDGGWYIARRILMKLERGKCIFHAAEKSMIRELSIMRIPVITRELSR